ncbi:hypothetical protein M9Y10_010882 [Tritrichomonas musculus]|uniref:BTB domain-containing protein n=1 Tax=Tritrichomonas musculus TaxID=1915356 RepID=A0ABR2ILX7_9EUKA
MFSTNQIQLKTKSILKVPLEQYDSFHFIVNDKEFKTTRIIADLLSPKICQIHQCDPTIDCFTITTQNEGDFSTILKLINFQKQDIPDNEINFISEIVEILENDFINVDLPIPEITDENVFNLLQRHLKSKIFYSELISSEIDFISSNFFRIIEEDDEKIMQMDIETIEKVIKNTNLVLRNEDQLLTFINKLYASNSKYSKLYQFCIFENVEKETIDDFLSIYNISDISNEVWVAISIRLKQQIIKDETESEKNNSRYKQVSANIL